MKTNAKPGDYIEIHFSKVIYEGVLLEVPESEKGIVLLKLDSGYNIGFNRKDVLEIKLKKKSKEFDENFKIKNDSKKPTIAMILTGGTIASKYNPKTGGVHPLTKPEEFFKYYPEILDKVNVNVEIPFMKASEDMGFKDLQKISKIF